MRYRSHTNTVTCHKIYPCNENVRVIGRERMKDKVIKALSEIRPLLQADGGDVELIDVNDGVVKVRLQGACGSCPMASLTLKNGVEKILKEQVPGVKEVVAV